MTGILRRWFIPDLTETMVSGFSNPSGTSISSLSKSIGISFALYVDKFACWHNGCARHTVRYKFTMAVNPKIRLSSSSLITEKVTCNSPNVLLDLSENSNLILVHPSNGIFV